jgi:hypothetical protein
LLAFPKEALPAVLSVFISSVLIGPEARVRQTHRGGVCDLWNNLENNP